MKFILKNTLDNICVAVKNICGISNNIKILEIDSIMQNALGFEIPDYVNTSTIGYPIGLNIADIETSTIYTDIIDAKGIKFNNQYMLPIISTKTTALTNEKYSPSLIVYSSFYDGAPFCGRMFENMANLFRHCTNMTGSPVCGPNVNNMSNTYSGCSNLTGEPVCGSKVLNMYNTYFRCLNLTGSPVCGPNVNNMSNTYSGCFNLTGSPVCGPNVNNMSDTYSGCFNLTGSPACGNNVTNMSNTYHYCSNLTGEPVCGPEVRNMFYTYVECNNLTGSPVCGPKVLDMPGTYSGCFNLTGSPACGNNVINMTFAYHNCHNLTGSPVIGLNVMDMFYTYANCYNLTGSIILDGILGSNRSFNLNNTFLECRNLQGIYIAGTLTQRSLVNLNHALFTEEPRPQRINILTNNVNVWSFNWITITGCLTPNTMTAAELTAINNAVELPFTYGNGKEYYRKNYAIKRCKYNALWNVYIYCTV